MKRTFLPVALFLSALLRLSAAGIDDPKAFVTEVYRRLTVSQSAGHDYNPPEDIYTARLAKLIHDDEKRAKGEVGCLDFVFWVNGQDWVITNLTVSSSDEGPQRKMIVAKFRNTGDPEEIHFDFRRNSGHWLLDDVQSLRAPQWTLSKILKCTP